MRGSWFFCDQLRDLFGSGNFFLEMQPSFKIQVKGLLEGQELIYRYYDNGKIKEYN